MTEPAGRRFGVVAAAAGHHATTGGRDLASGPRWLARGPRGTAERPGPGGERARQAALAAAQPIVTQLEDDVRAHLQDLAGSPRLLDPARLREAIVLLEAAAELADRLAAVQQPGRLPRLTLVT